MIAQLVVDGIEVIFMSNPTSLELDVGWVLNEKFDLVIALFDVEEGCSNFRKNLKFISI